MLILGKKEVESLLTMSEVIDAVEAAYREKDTGSGEIWPMVFHEFEPGVADLDIKSGNLKESGIFGLKLVSWYGENPEKNLPALYGTTMVFDLATGKPTALLNAGPITHYRTGAAAALGLKYLADPQADTMLMVGCGALAPYLIAASLLVKPKLKAVTLVNPHRPTAAAERLVSIREKVEVLLAHSGMKLTAEMKAEENVESAVRENRIILTATPSYQAMIRAEWVQAGTHFSCIGSDISGKQEIDEKIFRFAKAFGDDAAQCFQVGECEAAYKQGILSQLCGEIGAVINKKIPGRTGSDEVTVFDSTGIALQDLACAAVVVKAAEQKGIGLYTEL